MSREISPLVKRYEGVIVYEVLQADADAHPDITRATIQLRTPAALPVGGVFRSANGVVIQVIGASPGGFTVRIDDLSHPPQLRAGQLLSIATPRETGRRREHAVGHRAGWMAASQSRLLRRRRDHLRRESGRPTRDGTGDVNTPSVIGLGGWQAMKHLFHGGDGIIYAVVR